MSARKLTLLSIVIPAYNEQEGLPHLREVIVDWIAGRTHAVEVVIANDGSKDGTGGLLDAWAAECSWLKVIHLSRNFGHQAALTAALDHAQGDAVVIMDADLQDPVEVVPAMIAEYERGFDIVHGIRRSRKGETLFKRATAWLYYRFMRALVHPDLPADAGDFRLVSDRCLAVVKTMRESHRFLRGMFSWVGFPQAFVQYERHERCAGQTHYPFRRMLLLAWDSVLSFSPLPLRLILLQGLITAGFGGCYGIYAAVRWFVLGDTVVGWPTLVILLCLIGGAILVGIGVMGEYVSRIYEELKARPLYIVERRRNV